MKKIFAVVFAGVMLMLWATEGYCKDETDKALVYATQNRVFHRPHELGFFTGYIADNDFYNVYPVGMSYTFNFNYNWAWEVARGEYMVNKEKDIKNRLETEFGVTPSEFFEPQYAIYTSAIWKPFYGKEAFRNRRILNHESYFLLGGGIFFEESLQPYEESDVENIKTANIGFGTKYFIGKNLCMNLEIRDLIKFRDDRTENNIYFGVTLGWRFNLRPRTAAEDQTIKKIKKYLDKKEREQDEK